MNVLIRHVSTLSSALIGRGIGGGSGKVGKSKAVAEVAETLSRVAP